MRNGVLPLAMIVLLLVLPGARAQDVKDDGICPPCSRPEEQKLFHGLTSVTHTAVVIVTKRNTRNSTGPRIAVDIEAKGNGCRWMAKAGAQLEAIGKVIAASPAGLNLPYLQYSIFKLGMDNERDFEVMPSNRIIRIADLAEAVKRKEPAVALFARGRLIAAGDATIERCLPKMLAGPEGESWEKMYGAPDPRPAILLPYVLICLKEARSEAERQECRSLGKPN